MFKFKSKKAIEALKAENEELKTENEQLRSDLENNLFNNDFAQDLVVSRSIEIKQLENTIDLLEAQNCLLEQRINDLEYRGY